MFAKDYSDVMECSCKLHDAILEGNLEMTKSLLQSEFANVNEADDRNGRTSLHLAAMRGRADLASLLLSSGADVCACDHLGNTPLHWCGHLETIELLAEHGAKVLQRNKRGLTARDLAERKGVSATVLHLLQQLETEVTEQDDQGHSDADDASYARFSPLLPGNKRSRSSGGQPLSGLWRDLACELGGRNSLLLVLGLLGLSLYVATLLMGLNYGGRQRIPINGSGDDFKVKV